MDYGEGSQKEISRSALDKEAAITKALEELKLDADRHVEKIRLIIKRLEFLIGAINIKISKDRKGFNFDSSATAADLKKKEELEAKFEEFRKYSPNCREIYFREHKEEMIQKALKALAEKQKPAPARRDEKIGAGWANVFIAEQNRLGVPPSPREKAILASRGKELSRDDDPIDIII